MAVAKQMGKVAADHKVDFIVSVGDHFYDQAVESTDDKAWKINFEEVYSAPSLQVPWYVCLGNHDYYGSVQAQIDYTKKSSRWHLPDRYYSIEKEVGEQTDVTFLFLDTPMMFDRYFKEKKSSKNLEGIDKTKQFEWFDERASKITSKWKIVVGHHPVYSAYTLEERIPMWDQVQPRLEKLEVDAYFSGHEHDFQHTRVGKINYFVSGAGSKVRQGKKIKNPNTLFLKQGVLGFILVSLSETQMQVQYIDCQGSVLYTVLLTKP